ncbi:MAG: polysaccharide deacetylase family protein [Clostridia bacterium]|nr:polysaccharide deacetylase family protein [Clostridia bacterium]
MKKLILTLSSLAMAATVTFTAYAAPAGWYCKRNKEHKQPTLDSNMAVIEQYNAYYVDKNHGDTSEEKVLYLTFDAGYENGNVEKILNTLKDENVPAAFFILDNLILKNTDLVKRMAAEGHTVCNHTMKHRDMTKVTDIAEFEAELTGLERLYEEKIGAKMAKFYRPPEGKFSEQNLQFATELGYTTVFWSFAYADWDNKHQMSEEEAMKKVMENTHNGAILLFHPTSETNAKILPRLIAEWKAQGYRFGTLDELKKG